MPKMLKIKDLMSPKMYKEAIEKRISTIEQRLKTLKDRKYDMPGDISEFNEWSKELKKLEKERQKQKKS